MMLWLNGALLDSADARIDPADRGLTLGDGLFETIRAAAGRPVWLDRHLARLRTGAALLGIPLAWSDADIAQAIERLLAALEIGAAAVRLTLTRGPAPRGLLPPAAPDPTLLLTAGPLPPPAAPARAIVASATRRNEFSPLARIKSLNYLDNILARQEASARGGDEALMLNTRDRLVEATIGNLFLLIDGRLVTPPVADGALPGIMRAGLIERCGAVERSLVHGDLAAAEAGFLSNALGLRPIETVDGRSLGSVERALRLVADCRAALG